ncbi:MAG: hypothetical protein AB2733_17440 [Candidatus Thiodiazotropha taylori]
MMKSVKPGMALLVIQLLAQGCGGGGSSDNPTDTNDPVNNNNPVDTNSGGYDSSEEQAVVAENNAKDFAISAASGAKQVVDEHGIEFPMQTAAKSYSGVQPIQPMVIIVPTKRSGKGLQRDSVLMEGKSSLST